MKIRVRRLGYPVEKNSRHWIGYFQTFLPLSLFGYNLITEKLIPNLV